MAVYHIKCGITHLIANASSLKGRGPRPWELPTVSQNIHTTVNSTKALGTHGFHLPAHTGRAKQMKGERSG